MHHLPDVFAASAEKYPAQGFYSKDSHKFFKPTLFSSLYNTASAFAIHLIQGGLKPGDRVALFGDNSAEWLIADMAIQMAGAIVVPRGSDSTPQELEFILNHAEAEICFVEHWRLYKKIAATLKKRGVRVYVLDAAFPEKAAAEEKLIILPQL
ncbi:MAG: AMP-binding protein, partial [Spirochaetes bacterium]|nr:AMP-binding protein [Spirochaetota bacterium]